MPHIIPALAMLTVAATTAMATPQDDLAARIETLAYSHPAEPPTVDPTIDFQIYLPTVMRGTAISVENCIFRLQITQYSQAFAPFVSATVDLDLATLTLPLGDDGLRYMFDETPDTSLYLPENLSPQGSLFFEAPADAPFALMLRQPTVQMNVLETPPTDWPVVQSDQPAIMFTLNHDVTEKRISDLSDAVALYQQEYCLVSS